MSLKKSIEREKFDKEYAKLPKCKYCGYYLCPYFNQIKCKEIQERKLIKR